MDGYFAKIIDKSFLIGFFVPATLFIFTSMFILPKSIFDNIFPLTDETILTETVKLLILSWILGILLSVSNRTIIRILEGYGALNPLRLFIYIERNIYKNLVAEYEELGKVAQKTEFIINRRAKIKEKLAMQFPRSGKNILPTRFGNVIRASEDYPREMYGFEPVIGWCRLLTVIPQSFQELIDSSFAEVNFWVNLGILNLFFVLEYITCCVLLDSFQKKYILIISFVLALISCSRARSAAQGWGEMLKASFDIYLPKLQTEIGAPIRFNNRKEKWTKFSQGMVYRMPSVMDEFWKEDGAEITGTEEDKVCKKNPPQIKN